MLFEYESKNVYITATNKREVSCSISDVTSEKRDFVILFVFPIETSTDLKVLFVKI